MTRAVPLTTLMLIHDLKAAVSEDERRAIREKLLDLLHESRLTEEREAIGDALLGH